MAELDRWLLEHLRCPRDRNRLQIDGRFLTCADGHRYPVVLGVPVMLINEDTATIDIGPVSLSEASKPHAEDDPFHLATLSLSDQERNGIAALARQPGPIDPVVAYLIAATNGLMYRHLIGTLTRYPIPDLPMPEGSGRRLLDVGCSWGRWTIAAAAHGYDAVGIDPSLGAVLAARRVARQLDRSVRYVVADARRLPFADGSFDAVYSYSVLQHFSHPDAARAIGEIGRVLVADGVAKVQLPTRYGIRCLYHQLRRGFRPARGFEVRYWSWRQLRQAFAAAVGPATFQVDGYFGIGLQASDAAMMPPRLATILRVSEMMKRISRVVTPLRRVADSVFVEAVRRSPAGQ